MTQSIRHQQFTSGRGGVRASGLYEARTSTEFGICQGCRAAVPLPRCRACPKGKKAPTVTPLRVSVRPLTWTEESELVARASLPNGRLNPAEVTRHFVRHALTSNNFDLTPDSLEGITDRNLGWHLFDLLGGVRLIEELTGRSAEELREHQEALRKNS